jgi:hypothetical protein
MCPNRVHFEDSTNQLLPLDRIPGAMRGWVMLLLVLSALSGCLASDGDGLGADEAPSGSMDREQPAEPRPESAREQVLVQEDGTEVRAVRIAEGSRVVYISSAAPTELQSVSPWLMGYPIEGEGVSLEGVSEVLLEIRWEADVYNGPAALYVGDWERDMLDDATPVAVVSAQPGEVGQLVVDGQAIADLGDPSWMIAAAPQDVAVNTVLIGFATVTVTGFWDGPVPPGFSALDEPAANT